MGHVTFRFSHWEIKLSDAGQLLREMGNNLLRPFAVFFFCLYFQSERVNFSELVAIPIHFFFRLCRGQIMTPHVSDLT